MYLFVPQNAELLAEYEHSWSLRDVFAPNGDPAPGIVTTHDDFAISWTADEAAEKVERLLATATEAQARELFKLCSQDQWRYTRAKQELADGAWRERIVPILYRPFDIRWTVYDRNVAVHRRERVSDQLVFKNNVALITSRQRSLASEGWANVFVTTKLIESCSISNKTKEINYALPLWLYAKEAMDLLDASPREKITNLAPEFIAALKTAIGQKITPEDTLAYIYALLYTPSYRTRYADFLKRDFPRVQLTNNRQLFLQMVGIGHELIALHTMKTKLSRITRYDIVGSNEVMKVRYAEPIPATPDRLAQAGRVYVNSEQFFDGVPQAVWSTYIGGYCVADKWLKDRKGRLLNFHDIEHYHHIVAALARTLELQTELDTAIEQAGGWPLQ